MRVALAPFLDGTDARSRLRALDELAAEYSEWGCDLLVTGELSLCDPAQDPLPWLPDGPEVRRIRAIAARHRLHLAVGFCDVDGGVTSSSYLVTDRAGATLAHARRPLTLTHVTGNSTAFTVADKRCVLALGDDFDGQAARLSTLTPDIVLWPRTAVGTAPSPKDLPRDAETAAQVYAAALMVTSASAPGTGAAAWFRRGRVKAQLEGPEPPVLVADIF